MENMLTLVAQPYVWDVPSTSIAWLRAGRVWKIADNVEPDNSQLYTIPCLNSYTCRSSFDLPWSCSPSSSPALLETIHNSELSKSRKFNLSSGNSNIYAHHVASYICCTQVFSPVNRLTGHAVEASFNIEQNGMPRQWNTIELNKVFPIRDGTSHLLLTFFYWYRICFVCVFSLHTSNLTFYRVAPVYSGKEKP